MRKISAQPWSYLGKAFPDLADIELFRPELDDLEESWLNVYQNLIEVELALGRHGTLVGDVQSMVAQHRYEEQLWASLVLALCRCDRQADALAACRQARQVFIEDLGIDPDPRLQTAGTGGLTAGRIARGSRR
ncbi:AfsR/SARP family transcriptional regulator [Arthrobacter sp. TMN-37]